MLPRVAILLLIAACASPRSDYVQSAPVTPAPTPAQWADQMTADEMAQVEVLRAKPPAKLTPAQKELLAKADRVAQQAAARRADARHSVARATSSQFPGISRKPDWPSPVC